MCILFLIINSNPQQNGYKFILASNRDEFYSRPALPAAKWDTNENVFGGRDMEIGREGGTWLAIGTGNDTFKMGALLNLTGEPKRINALGRGPIVSNYVGGNLTNLEYTNNLVNNDVYNCFNLVSIEIK